MGRPSAAKDLLEEALRRVDAGAHRDDVAAELAAEGRPISSRTIRRAQDERRAAGLPRQKLVKLPPKPAKVSSTRAPSPPPPPPPPVDAITELDGLIKSTKAHQTALVGKQGYSGAGTLLVSLIKLRRSIEREREKPGSELSTLLAKGPQAVAKIRQGAAVIAAREAETGLCARCGAKMKPEAQ